MALNLKSRNFLTLLDFTPEEIRLMLDVSHEYKRLKRAGISHKIHEGKQVALLSKKLQLELELLLLWRLEIWESTQNS